MYLKTLSSLYKEKKIRKRLNVSKYFVAQREIMEEKICTDEGIQLRVNRSIQAEGVFAMIKEDMEFRIKPRAA